MECLSGIGAAVAAGAAASTAAGTYKYNRGNFKDDRDQRRRAAVKAMGWRVEQAKLWRQDVRDLISLTEYKMHMYLIVNVLVLGFTIFLWTEGRLPAGTPQWLMVGSSVSIGASFMFLLLSIWMAMHAAISAQSYEARLLTQMVRLPIPTWEEFEATRTYASEFEKLEGRQMFRVPWLMGWQENLIGSRQARAGQANASDVANPDESSPPMASAAEAASTVASEGGTGVPDNVEEEASSAEWAVDPWGLEQAGAGMPELGCSYGADVAKLRHVKLARRAAIQWQTFDAFSRISMSMGVQQMMQAMSYYILGYLLVQVGSKTAAVLGVIVFAMISQTILTFDVVMSSPWKLRLAQFLLLLGPAASATGACYWAQFENSTTEYIVPIAFAAHGFYFLLILCTCDLQVTKSGAWLPKTFRSVLYLDVFSWCKVESNATPVGRNAPDFPTTGAEAGRPALQAVRYGEDGMPVPLCPTDMKPSGVRHDLMHAVGAPAIHRPACGADGKGPEEEFYNPASFLQGGDDEHQHWVEKVGPGELPWRVFCLAMLLVSVAWLFAAAYCVHGAKTDWSLDLSIKELRHRPPQHRPGFLGPRAHDGHQWWDDLASGNSRAKWERWTKEDTVAPMAPMSMSEKSISLFEQGAARRASADALPEQIALSWPWPNIAPTHLSCDASGNHFVMADRLLMFSATLDSKGTAAAESKNADKPSAAFAEFECPALLGEGLEDVAMSCNASTGAGFGCEVLALHRHGRRLAACPLVAPKSGVVLAATDDEGISKVEEISDKWLERPRNQASEGAARSRIEKALSVSMSPECKGEVGGEFCTVLGTTHGRVVQLGRHSSRKELVPTEVLYEDHGDDRSARSSGMVRAFNRRYLGLLQPEEGNIGLLDLSKGGLTAGAMSLGLSKPVASFCAGGGHIYMLTRGREPEMWRIPVPYKLRPDALLPLLHDP